MDTDLEAGVFLRYKFTVNFVRVITSYMSPAKATFVCDIVLDDEVSQFDLNVRNAFDRIKGWISMKENVLIYSKDNPLGKMLESYKDEDGDTIHNERMILPYEPVDDMIALAFLRKLNAIGSGFVAVGSITMTSSDSEGMEVMAFGENGDYFPVMETWMGERTYFSRPWWDRNDASSIDTVPPEGADLNSAPDYAISLTDTIAIPEQETKIIRPEFKPRVIKGDLDV